MKTLYPLISLFLLFHLFSSCSTDCPDNTPTTSYVDQAYLPDIIPYSDTSTARFLKNGKDTLVFSSQGLKETFESGSTLSSDCQKSYKNQQYSLTMAASDTDFFKILYFSKFNGASRVKFNFKNQNNDLEFSNYSFRRFYPPIINITILNTQYDTVNVFPIDGATNVYFKPNIGIIKISTPTFTYELIK